VKEKTNNRAANYTKHMRKRLLQLAAHAQKVVWQFATFYIGKGVVLGSKFRRILLSDVVMKRQGESLFRKEMER
jgi:hypothetical protein